MIFSKQSRELIEAAVKTAEGKTSGEIVPVVLPVSGDYRRVGHRLGLAGFALGTAAAAWLHHRYPFFDLWYLLSIQWLGWVFGWFLGRLPQVIRLFVGEKRMALEVDEAAYAAFTRYGLHRTRDRTGVLILISLLERRVEILADEGIHQRVGEGYWKIEVQKISLGIQQKRAGETLAQVIHEIGGKLAEHFPRSANDKNELGDELRLR